jgi:uncharacterized membrane protein YebE (DUF533 family)
MNLVGTLGKILLSGALNKGGSGGLGSLLGGASGGSAGGLGDLLGGLAGGQGGAAGGLGDLLGQLQKQGGATQAGGAGAGGLLGGLLGGGDPATGGLGGLLGSALGQQGQAAPPAPTPEQSDHAALLIRSMINAAKCDGSVDQHEQEKIVGKLGDIDAQEAAFIRNEMQAPLDVDAFVRSVPRGMEQQVYAVSVMSINLDSKVEADYLDKLAKGLNISEQVSNQMHTEMGVPVLYG